MTEQGTQTTTKPEIGTGAQQGGDRDIFSGKWTGTGRYSLSSNIGGERQSFQKKLSVPR